IGSTAFTILGMPLFDSICHTMSALSTAGFSTKNDSILAYNSILIESVMIILMIIGASNFSVLDLLFRGKFRQALRDSEFRFMWIILIVCSILAGIDLYRHTDGSFLFSLHRAIFGVVSISSTTGYATMDYSNWPAFSLGILMILMVIGGCTGSTAGGIKMYRAYLLIRIAATNFRRRMNPARNVILLTYRKHEAEQTLRAKQMEDIFGFVFLYVMVLLIGILLTTLTAGCSLQTAAFEFTSVFTTVGISAGLTSATLPESALIVLMIGMILGRLEVTIVFVGLYSLIRKVERRI
ncbi:MAG: TrkH family potassium uptake protein, partial [Anaerovoracaceae bacterium]